MLFVKALFCIYRDIYCDTTNYVLMVSYFYTFLHLSYYEFFDLRFFSDTFLNRSRLIRKILKNALGNGNCLNNITNVAAAKKIFKVRRPRFIFLAAATFVILFKQFPWIFLFAFSYRQEFVGCSWYSILFK